MTDAKQNNDTSKSTDQNQETAATTKAETTAANASASNSTSAASSAHRKTQRKLSRSQKIEPVKTKRRTNPVIGFLVGLNTLVLIVILAASFWGWKQWQVTMEQQQAKQAEQAQALNRSLDSKIVSLQRDMQAALERSMATVNASEQQLHNQFQTLKEEIEQQLVGSEQDLDMAEVAYLVRMAARKVNVEKQVNSAIHLLHEADKQLAVQEDLNHTTLRERIATDIHNLRELKAQDIADNAFLIGAILNKVPALQFPSPEQYFSVQADEPSSDPADWWQNLKILWRNLVDDFLTVEKLDSPVTPYLNKQEQILTRNALTYHLLTMRQALLQYNEALFKQATEQALASMANFAPSEIATQLITADLETLQQMTFPKDVAITLSSLEHLINGGGK